LYKFHCQDFAKELFKSIDARCLAKFEYYPMYMKKNGMIEAYFLGHCASQWNSGIPEACLLIGIALHCCQLFESQRYMFTNHKFRFLRQCLFLKN